MKKALALILATAMACSLLLTGCGGGGAASGSGSAADGSAKQSLTLGTGGTTGHLLCSRRRYVHRCSMTSCP